MPVPLGKLGKEVKEGGLGSLGEEQETSLIRLSTLPFQGFNEGLATTLGAPVDVINFAMRKIGLPSSKRPFFGSRQLNELSEALGISGMEARTRLERYLKRVGFEVGANAPLMLPVLRAAGKLSQAERMGRPLREVGAVRETGREMLRRIGRSPGGATVGENVAAAGAGAGAAISQDIKPDSVGAEMAGQLVGSIIPSIAPTGLIRRQATRVGKSVFQRIQPEAMRKSAQSKTGEVLQGIVSENFPAFEEAQAFRQKIPGFDPSLAEATRAPSLIRAQEALESTLSGTDLDSMIARRQANLNAIDDYVSLSAPEGLDNPQLVVDAANNRLLRTKQKLSADIGDLGEARIQHGEGVSSLKIDRVSTGNDIRNSLRESMRERSAQMTVRAEELGVNRIDLRGLAGGQLAEDTKDIANLYGKYIKDRLGSETVDLADKLGLLDIPPVTDPAQPVTFGFLKTLRENVSRDYIAAASGANVNRAEVSLLGRMKSRIDELVGKLGDEIGEPDLAANYDKFRKEYLEDFINVFDEGVAIKSRQLGAKGFYLTPDENVASLFFGPDSKKGALSAARKWMDVFGPEKSSAMSEIILDDLSRSVVKDGVVDPKAVRRWASSHKEVLGVLGFDPDIFTAKHILIEDGIVSRISKTKTRQRKVENSILARMMKNPSIPPDQIISDALKNPKKLQTLLRSVKGVPEAMAALKRAAWAEASKIQDPGEMFRYISDNDVALSRILSPDHVRNLKDIQIARTISNAVEQTGGQPLTFDPFSGFERATGFTVDSASNRLLQMHMRQIGLKYLASNAIARYIRRFTRNHAEVAMREALYDADIAKEWSLLTKPTITFRTKLQDKVARRLNTRLFNLGIQSRTRAMTLELKEDREPEIPVLP